MNDVYDSFLPARIRSFVESLKKSRKTASQWRREERDSHADLRGKVC
jgi:hypothetical protein